MASITRVVVLAVALGCSGHDTDPQAPPRPAECVPVPDGSVPPLEPVVRLFPENRGDFAGRDLDVYDHDCDGYDDLLVSADYSWHPLAEYGADWSAFYLIRAPVTGGDLAAEADVWWDAHGEVDGFGSQPLFLHRSGQVGATGSQAFGVQADVRFLVFDVPEQLPAPPQSHATATARLNVEGYTDLSLVSFSGRCTTPMGAALCLSGTAWQGGADQSGHVLVYELPVEGPWFHVYDASSWLKGDTGDSARTLAGDDDLDGDGRADLVVGAFGWSSAKGRLAVVTEIPPGEHRLWDVAGTTLSATAEGEEFGLGLATGDLDGDGHPDVLGGSPLGDGGAFVFLGPFDGGDRTTEEAEVSVTGGLPGEWLGYALTAGDLTGDGGADLAVGAPWSAYASDAPPGAVLVFDDPEGALDVSDATWRLVSGVQEPDAFGIALKQGDLDGDGKGDLVVGAPRDPTVAPDAGSVTLLSGAALY